MSDVLFLAHRLPYPPNKGDKIRSFRLFSALARRHTMHLATFVDSDADWEHTETLSRMCASSLFLPLRKSTALMRGALSMAGGRSLSLGFYSNRRLRQWVSQLFERAAVARVALFTSTMSPYAMPAALRGVPVVADFCDVDSEKWLQYADRSRWPLTALYRRECTLLRAAEARFASTFAATTFVSQQEADLFCRLSCVPAARVRAIPNGIDTRYFDPHAPGERPFAEGSPAIVFTGAMDYRPNIDAVEWFAEAVLPRVRTLQPGARFFVVGSNPAARVLRLGDQAGVVVTGTVPDVRPYLRFADVAVAPLQIARGVQNKVLEALAMRCPIVASPAALTGLQDVERFPSVVSADGPDAFAKAVCEAIASRPDASLDAVREHVRSHYSWDASMAKYLDLVDGSGRPQWLGEPAAEAC